MELFSEPEIALPLILIAGIGAQWLAARLHQPAILPLLLLGFGLGPLTGLLNPDAVFGDLLLPAISLSVAIILFEGAMTLRIATLRDTERIILRLITIGVAVTVTGLAACAHVLFGFPLGLALLFGAIGAVSGPTVILPLLRSARPSERVSQIVKWEGILLDPLGAVLAVVVFEAIIASAHGDQANAALSLFKVLSLGSLSGVAAGFALGFLLKRHLLPDFLINGATLALVLLTFSLSNMFAAESGLVAVTAMGLVIGNLKAVRTEQLIDFKESLSLLLISVLFIVLAARIDFNVFTGLVVPLALLLAAAVFIIRPLSVWAATLGADISWRERILVGWIAPRGIVAAAIAAVFAFRLEDAGMENAALLVPLTLALIVASVIVYSLSVRPMAKLLKLAEPATRGALIVGGNPVALAIAKALHDEDVPVKMADTDWEQVHRARMAGLSVFYGNPVSDQAERGLDLIGIGRLFAMSRRPSLNALSCLKFRADFGKGNVFSVRLEDKIADKETETVSVDFRGNLLFKPDMTLEKLEEMLVKGEEIRITQLSDAFSFDALRDQLKGIGRMLLAVSPRGVVHPFSEETPLRTSSGWKIAYIAPSRKDRDRNNDGKDNDSKDKTPD